jgi:hypothetical protein
VIAFLLVLTLSGDASAKMTESRKSSAEEDTAGVELERRHSAPVLRLNGEALLALEAVLQNRRQDKSLAQSEQDARNFLITVLRKDPLLRAVEEGKALVVNFSPRYAPGESEKLHGATVLGRRLYYVVSLKDFAILRTGDPLNPLRTQ